MRGSQRYDGEGQFSATVGVTDVGGATLPGIGLTTVAVSDAAPTVAADHASVSAAENVAATNTGTFADFDQAVTITASSGMVTQSGSQSGTWGWSATAAHAPPYSVTITATHTNPPAPNTPS